MLPVVSSAHFLASTCNWKLAFLRKNPRKTDARVYIGTVCIQNGHATKRATASGVWI